LWIQHLTDCIRKLINACRCLRRDLDYTVWVHRQLVCRCTVFINRRTRCQPDLLRIYRFLVQRIVIQYTWCVASVLTVDRTKVIFVRLDFRLFYYHCNSRARTVLWIQHLTDCIRELINACRCLRRDPDCTVWVHRQLVCRCTVFINRRTRCQPDLLRIYRFLVQRIVIQYTWCVASVLTVDRTKVVFVRLNDSFLHCDCNRSHITVVWIQYFTYLIGQGVIARRRPFSNIYRPIWVQNNSRYFVA